MSGKKCGWGFLRQSGTICHLPRWAGLGIALLSFPCPAAPVVADILFGNGDQLSGLSHLAYEDDRLVMGGNNVVANGAKVPLKRLYKLRLSGDPLPASDANHLAELELSNGDLIVGQLDELTQMHVEMTVPGGGKQRFKRLMGRSLKIQHNEPPIFLGPTTLQNWTHSENAEAWSFRNRHLVSNGEGAIARKIELPDQCRLGFNLSWANQLRFRMLLFADQGDTATPDNCYDIVFQRRFAYVRKRWKTPNGGGSKTVGRPASLPALGIKNKVHMEFFLDRPRGIITLYIDGRYANAWADDVEGSPLLGNWLHFVSDDSALRISNLACYPWHGTLPEDPNAPVFDGPPGPNPASPLENKNVVIRQIISTDDGDLLIKTPGADVPVPKDRGLTINLTTPDSERARRMKNDVRGWFHGSGRITFELRDITPESITGFNQAFGEATYSLAAFKHIEFNLYTEDLDARRAGLEWEEEE